MGKDARGHGGLIRKDKRVSVDKHGSTTVQHWDGRVDVNVKAKIVRGGAGVPSPNSAGEQK